MVAGRRFGPGAGPAALYWAISPHTGTRANLLSKGSHYAAFLRTVGAAVADGRIRYREDITDGFENAPPAFVGMLEGRNFGKALVRVTPSGN